MRHKMKAKNLTRILFGCVLAVSCTQKTPRVNPQPAVALAPSPTVCQAPATRGPVFGQPDGAGHYLMPGNSSFGLWICDHYTGSYTDGSNPYTEYALRYNNIRASRSGNTWYYNYFGYTGFPTLYITPKDENRDDVTDVSADIFAYAPYQDSATPESVPFSIAGGTDVMFAAENGVDNLDIDPADLDANPRYTQNGPLGRTLEVPLTFTHALALLEFDFWVKNRWYNHPDENGNALGYTLNSIKVTRREGGHPLYTSGKMNAMRSGLLYDLTESASVTVSGLAPHNGGTITVGSGNYSPGTAAKAYILQVPSQAGETYSDGDYTFEFHFSGQTYPVTFTLLREHIRHADGTTYGFQPGYRYTFKFEIDNYVHFEGVTVGEWETVEEPIHQTEI